MFAFKETFLEHVNQIKTHYDGKSWRMFDFLIFTEKDFYWIQSPWQLPILQLIVQSQQWKQQNNT